MNLVKADLKQRQQPEYIKRRRGSGTQLGIHLILIFLLCLVLLPFALMIMISLKDATQYMFHPFTLTWPIKWSNYSTAYYGVFPSVVRTLILAVVCISLSLLTSSLASYALARYKFPGNKLIYYFIFGLMFIPGVVVLVPLYLWNLKLGLKGIWGLFATYWVLGHPFAVFFLTNAFRSISEELLESARCDGAGHLTIWRRIMLPLSRPVMLTLAMMNLLWIYNGDYVWQKIMTDGTGSETVSVALSALRHGFGGQILQPGIEMAGYVVGSLPLTIAFLLASRVFVRGLTAGAIKG
jgi:ABC-type glycerol-3-phosphate transport system permease component